MKIWIVNHYYIPPHCAGGTRHHNIAKKLIEKGHQVTIFASNFNHFTKEQIDIDFGASQRVDEYEQIKVVWLKTRAYQSNGLSRLLGMLDFARAFKKAAVKYEAMSDTLPDLIIGSNPHLFAANEAMRFARKKGIRFVYEIRDVWPESLIDIARVSTWHPLMIYMAFLQKKLVKNSEKVITLLPLVGQYLSCKFALDTEKVIYFPNFIEVKQNQSNETVLGKDAKKRFIYAGSHGPANGLSTLIEAATILQQKKLSHIEITLIGDGPEKPRLKKAVFQKQLTNVVFRDPVPKREIYQVISQADFGLMLLKASDVFRWGVSPNKLFDYMVLSKPVLFAVNSSNNPINKAEAGLTVKPDSPQELAAAIERLASMDKQVVETMGNNARRYVEKHHNLATLTEHLIEELA